MTIEGALEAQAAARQKIEARVTALVIAQWDSLPTKSDETVAEFVARVLPLVTAGQNTTALLTSTYLANVVSTVTGEVTAPATVGGLGDLRGTPPAEVYRRPFVEVYTALKNGASYDQAISNGRDRLGRLVQDDLSLAHRRAVLMSVGSDDRVTGYRRVVRPELARVGTCGLCIAAAGQVYKRERLLPVHTRCNCEVMPILRSKGGQIADPAHAINSHDVAALYRTIPPEQRNDLSSARFAIHEHGELGPVLRRDHDKFTGPADIEQAAA